MSSAFSIDFLEPTSEIQMPATVVAGTVGNQVGHSLSEFGISHNQVVCQGKLQQSLSFHIPNTETFAMLAFMLKINCL